MRLRFFLVSSPLQLPDGSVFSFRKKTPDGELPFRNLELSDENWTGLIPRGIPFHRSFFQNLLKTYFEILQIPSASGKESMLRSYLLQKLE